MLKRNGEEYCGQATWNSVTTQCFVNKNLTSSRFYSYVTHGNFSICITSNFNLKMYNKVFYLPIS